MKRFKTKMVIMGAVVTVLGGACGGGGDSGATSAGDEAADRTVEIAMTDNKFDPTSLSVSAGETVTFNFTNNGSVAHDAYIGNAEDQQEHGESMDSGMEGHNMEGGDALLLKPGKTGQLTYTFEGAGEEILIGCHQPGHYEAGMKSTISVA